MKINTTIITGMVITLIMVLVLFSILPSVVPTVALNVQTLFNTANLGNATVVGAGPAAFAANVDDYLGWFWVVGPFILAIGTILALFLNKGRR